MMQGNAILESKTSTSQKKNKICDHTYYMAQEMAQIFSEDPAQKSHLYASQTQKRISGYREYSGTTRMCIFRNDAGHSKQH